MHVPDGFLNAPVSVATGAFAAAAVAVSLRGARRELAGGPAGSGGPAGAEGTAPLAGLVAAFVFAVQMLNFPVAAGTSGHLLGGALAAILVGPFTGVLVLAVVLLMQALLFADGGLTALGTNITLMGVVTVLVAHFVFRGVLRVLPRGRGAVGVASFAAALLSVPASAVAFVLLYAVGGTADVSLGRVFAAMAGVHVLIGLGEAAITTATVGAVLAVRPDLVRAASHVLRPKLVLRGSAATEAHAPAGLRPARGGQSARPAAGASVGAEAGGAVAADAGSGGAFAEASSAEGADARTGAEAALHAAGAAGGAAAQAARPAGSGGAAAATAAGPGTGRPRGLRALWLGGVAVVLVLAGFVSFYASAEPDGLERVATDEGFAEEAEEHGLADSPLADYGVRDVDSERLSVGLAGAAGVAVTLAAGTAVFLAARGRAQKAGG
ncbi:energy-coupling factor ABC transporter permease [Streptomyces sp. DSM 44917]|uniref:Energy-coupling factor ABC transporter permease n=1 Tax=Streptomyces boetiae TaxID=3075541 RepID=A0ABU2LBY4_9ACTN|nr:energy-coupling factor ABC transporter permease [Streptomyces sp. DSM 44917]MDT0309092.1 energy-coupling factor ABC transporter permease [Streptomyces sp. DSM 44917]